MEYDDGEWTAAHHVRLRDLCKSEQAKRVEKLRAYADSREGEPDYVVLKVRKVLETHFRRSFTAYFAHKRNLGEIVRDIDNYSGAHPCAGVRDKLDELNKATCDHYHGESAEAVPKTGVDPDELRVIVEDTLEVIGAREPSNPPTPARPVPSITSL